MHHGINPLHHFDDLADMPEIALHDFQIRMTKDLIDRVGVEHQQVEQPHAVSAAQQFGQQRRTDVAGSANHQHMFSRAVFLA